MPIKRGLERLRDLDVKPQKKPRTDEPGVPAEYDWGAIEAAFFGKDKQLQRWACDTTSCIRSQQQNLPPHVEATDLLVSAQLSDNERVLSQFDEDRVRTLYGAAVSRAVYFMLEAERQKETYRSKARMIGMPEELTETRNLVAHGQMPQLSMLRWVCGLGLQYLHRDWWTLNVPHKKTTECTTQPAGLLSLEQLKSGISLLPKESPSHSDVSWR